MESEPASLVLRDLWERLPGDLRAEFLRRGTEADWWALEIRPGDWEGMRPLVLSESGYHRFASLAAGVLRCALLACRRRAGTAGGLYRALDEEGGLRLLDPSQPLSDAGLLRMARPDALLADGRPWFVELNIGPDIYGVPELEERGAAFARRWPGGALAEPASTLRARAYALARAAASVAGAGPGRVLVPTWPASSGIAAKLGSAHALRAYLRPAAEAARAAGLEVSVADLSEVRGGSGGLWVGGDRVDVVFNQFASRVVTDGGSLALLRDAVLAGGARLFVPEASCLLSAKRVLAWMHEDLDLYDPADRALILRHVPWTGWLGPHQPPEARRRMLERAVGDRAGLVAKPSSGRGGTGFVAGHRLTDRQ